MNYFLYNPATQYDNTGDLLINKALVALLRKHGQVIIDDNDKPESFLSQLLTEDDQRLSAITDKRLFNFIEHRLNESAPSSSDTYYLVFVPGDLSVSGFKSALSRLRFFYRRLRKLNQMGCRILRLGISLNTFDLSNMLVESLYSRAYEVYGIRDQRSMAKASRFRFSHVHYFPDLAWAFDAASIQKTNPLPVDLGDYIVLSFRTNKHGIVHDHIYLKRIADKLRVILSEMKPQPKLVFSYQVKHDEQATQELAGLFAADFKVCLCNQTLDLSGALGLYTGARFILSNRLHVLLLGVLADTLSIPFVNGADNKKITAIFEDNNLGDLILDYGEKAQQLTAKFHHIVERSPAIVGEMRRITAINREQIDQRLSELIASSQVPSTSLG